MIKRFELLVEIDLKKNDGFRTCENFSINCRLIIDNFQKSGSPENLLDEFCVS